MAAKKLTVQNELAEITNDLNSALEALIGAVVDEVAQDGYIHTKAPRHSDVVAAKAALRKVALYKATNGIK